ncbi:uncharacterized protein FA14DRAFT_65710 [Meira miltonrushii]|uniref:Uncharacterized protein n=1 Tax=Meira miltonrushii TaxID=1280837 RepID=A0A316V8J9_9BASI|nr:uncharacterized protein FA14DRAFT_65710 [Meira miltonrushii]PWN33826.1 hypothetical protein FA14DRAFT_65710 [Meira miltonrushii]
MPRLREHSLFPSITTIVRIKSVTIWAMRLQFASITTSLFLFTFLFRCTFAAGLEKAPHYLPAPGHVHKSVLEGFRDHHIDRYNSAILPSNKARHNKAAHRYQHEINKFDPNLIHHEHVITYKDEKVHSIENREGFMKAKDPSILATSHRIASLYDPHPGPGLRNSQPGQKIIHVKGSSTANAPESAEKALEKVTSKQKGRSRRV